MRRAGDTQQEAFERIKPQVFGCRATCGLRLSLQRQESSAAYCGISGSGDLDLLAMSRSAAVAQGVTAAPVARAAEPASPPERFWSAASTPRVCPRGVASA